jgi:transposase-like protein
MTTMTREQLGGQIVQKGTEIERIDETHYLVNSQSKIGEYEVISTELGWTCSCPDHEFRRVRCKHIWAVELSLQIRGEVESKARTIAPLNAEKCVYCGSENLMRWGVRHNKSGDIQKFKCRECSKFFTINIGFEHMKHNPKAVTSAMQLYFSGESLRNTQRSLELLGVKVSHQTVFNWISKYVGLMERYLDKITPNVGSTWRADEVFVKVRGNMKYLYALMDDETRYWIAQEVAETKYTHDARSLFRKAELIAGKQPKTLITDGAPNYQDASIKEWGSIYPQKRTEHIRDIRLDGTVHNNKMERMNGEIRDREKVMRGIKTVDTPTLKGAQIYHNFIKPHEGLGGRTPAEACGIKVEGQDKWITLIQNAQNESR